MRTVKAASAMGRAARASDHHTTAPCSCSQEDLKRIDDSSCSAVVQAGTSSVSQGMQLSPCSAQPMLLTSIAAQLQLLTDATLLGLELAMQSDSVKRVRLDAPQPAVSGATSPQAQADRRKGIPWTHEEHRLFLLGLAKFGKGCVGKWPELCLPDPSDKCLFLL